MNDVGVVEQIGRAQIERVGGVLPSSGKSIGWSTARRGQRVDAVVDHHAVPGPSSATPAPAEVDDRIKLATCCGRSSSSTRSWATAIWPRPVRRVVVLVPANASIFTRPSSTARRISREDETARRRCRRISISQPRNQHGRIATRFGTERRGTQVVVRPLSRGALIMFCAGRPRCAASLFHARARPRPSRLLQCRPWPISSSAATRPRRARLHRSRSGGC